MGNRVLRGCALAAASLATAGACLARETFANWETAPVHPADMTPSGGLLLVANTADNRLEVFTLGGALPVWTKSIAVGLDPVSVRARTDSEAWVVNHVSDTVSVVNLATGNVVATIAAGDEPSDVVFAGAGANQRGFVSVSGKNEVRVFDPMNLAAAPQVVAIAGHEPRALATDGTRVFAAIFFAGNRSISLSRQMVSDPSGPWGGVNPPPNSGNTFAPPMTPGLPPPPATGMIVNRETVQGIEHWRDDNQHNWDNLVSWGLNQNAIAIINVATLGVTYGRNLGNIQTAIAVQPGTGKATVAQVYLRNEARFESVIRSQFPHVRIGFVDPVTAASGIVEINQHLFANPPIPLYIQNATPAQRLLSVADPRGIAWNAAGTSAYVSGMGSNNVIRTSATGVRQATIVVGQGPTGLAMDTARARLYCVNRFDGTVSVINTATDAEVGRVSYYDPTPAVIKGGRPLFYDAHQFSALGIASCAGCHVDGKTDMQAWDAGDPSGHMKVFNQTCNAGLSFAPNCADWHPMKGPLMTQTLVGAVGSEPLHWRGDREDLLAFSAGFPGFNGFSPPPSPAQMMQLEAFLATLRAMPQPNRTIVDALPASVAGYAGSPSSGAALFSGGAINGSSASCTQCHVRANGSGTTVVSASALGDSQGFKPAQLTDLYKQTGFSKTSLANDRGFGYGHDGSFDSVFNLLASHVTNFPAGQSGVDMRRDLEAFLMCFPSGTHPAVGAQATFDGTNNSAPGLVGLLSTMLSLADSGAVGVVAKGVVGGLPRGYFYVAGTGNMQSDRLAQVVTAAALRLGAAAGGEVTFTVVPLGSQTRIGVDRDLDGAFDRDELDAGTNPADPTSFPSVCPGDTNGDGAVNFADLNQVLSQYGQSGAPGSLAGDVNHDGVVDFADLNIVLSHFGEVC